MIIRNDAHKRPTLSFSLYTVRSRRVLPSLRGRNVLVSVPTSTASQKVVGVGAKRQAVLKIACAYGMLIVGMQTLALCATGFVKLRQKHRRVACKRLVRHSPSHLLPCCATAAPRLSIIHLRLMVMCLSVHASLRTFSACACMVASMSCASVFCHNSSFRHFVRVAGCICNLLAIFLSFSP